MFKSSSSAAVEPLQPHDHDIKGGRGHASSQHPGNQYFLQTVQDLKAKYVEQKNNYGKNLVAEECIRIIEAQNPPGRFIQENKRKKTWEVVPRDKVISKVKQAFRDTEKVTSTKPSIHTKGTGKGSKTIKPTKPITMSENQDMVGALSDHYGQTFAPNAIEHDFPADFDAIPHFVHAGDFSFDIPLPMHNLSMDKTPRRRVSSTSDEIKSSVHIHDNDDDIFGINNTYSCQYYEKEEYLMEISSINSFDVDDSMTYCSIQDFEME